MAPIIALAIVALSGFSALALNTAQDSSIRLWDQTAAQAATSTASQVWASETPGLPLTNPTEDRSSTGVAMRAQEVADVDGVTTNQNIYCETNTSSQFDEIFWDTGTPGGTTGNGGAYDGTHCTAPSSWTYSVEIQIPPIGVTLPSKCSTTHYLCLQVLTNQKMTNILGKTVGVNQTTVGTSSIGYACNSSGTTITNVHRGTLAAPSNQSSVTANFTASQAGDLLVAQLAHQSADNDLFSGPSGWTRATSAYLLNAGEAEVWYYPNAPAGLTSATFTTANSEQWQRADVTEWSGADTSSPLDQTGSKNCTSNVSSCTVSTSASDSAAGDLGITSYGINTNDTASPGTGWTQTWGDVAGGFDGDDNSALSSGVGSETPSASSSTTWTIALATFKAGSGGCTGTASSATYTQSGSVTPSGTLTLTLPAVSTSGDLLVVGFLQAASSVPSTPSNWATTATETNAGGWAQTFYYYDNNPGGIQSVSFTCTATCYGVMSEWSNTDTGGNSSVLDNSSGGTDTSSHTSETASTSTWSSGDLVMTLFYPAGAASETWGSPPSGWTNIGNSSGAPFTSDYKIYSSSGSISETESWPTSSSKNAKGIAAFSKSWSSSIALVQAGSVTSASTTSVTVTLPSASTAGDLLVITEAIDSTGLPSAPTGWTTSVTQQAGTNAQFVAIFTYPNNPGSITSVTVSCGTGIAGACYGQMSEWSGVSTTTTDNTASGSDTSSSPQETGTVSTSASGDLVITCFYPQGASSPTFTTGTGFTQLGASSAAPMVSDYQVNASQGTVSETEKWSVSASHTAWAVVSVAPTTQSTPPGQVLG